MQDGQTCKQMLYRFRVRESRDFSSTVASVSISGKTPNVRMLLPIGSYSNPKGPKDLVVMYLGYG